MAKGATIEFVVSASTASSDGVTLSAQYIVNNNLAPVMTLSFGLCEAQMGSGNQFFNSLWQQAAAQGISVFVAAGDTGSAGCDVPYSANSERQEHHHAGEPGLRASTGWPPRRTTWPWAEPSSTNRLAFHLLEQLQRRRITPRPKGTSRKWPGTRAASPPGRIRQ